MDISITASTPPPLPLQHDWYNIPPKQTSWLVDGLIPADGHTAIIGKPKAGKSSFARSLIASVIKNTKFVGRTIDIPTGTGKVLYIHLDRKDVPWRVSQELRDTLGITQEESKRLHMRFADNMPKGDYNTRLKWLKQEAEIIRPHLIVIDLMWQFAEVRDGNAYQEVLKAINDLQDALSSIHYQGALVVTLHARKATNLEDEADDVIGSSAQRGSFVTGIYLSRDRNAGYYTIMSDQTVRDDLFGEIEKSVLIRNPNGTLQLGQQIKDVAQADKQNRTEADFQRILDYIAIHPACDVSQIMSDLSMSKKHILAMLQRSNGLVRSSGMGVKGDPKLYYVTAEGGYTQ